ncbi:hypothetical protein EON65_47220 [archaeon]|nr:MAG: hypothetical protein EON65_47220 [archaeon]
MASRNLTKKFVDMRKAARASRGHKFDDHDRESGDGVLLKVFILLLLPVHMGGLTELLIC